MRDDPRLKAWHDLCEPCLASFKRWRDAPNPAAWTKPAVQASPYLLGFLQACRAAGPSPQAWRETVSAQLLLIRRICTDNRDGTHGEYTPLLPPDCIIWPETAGEAP